MGIGAIYTSYEQFRAAFVALQLMITQMPGGCTYASLSEARWMVQNHPEWADRAADSM